MGAKSFAAALSVLAASGTAAQNTRPEADPNLEEIVVYGFSRDYLANKGQSSAVGLDLTQLETPAAISVISQDLLQDQQVNNVDDALRNVAGVTKFKTGNGGEEKFAIRGFDASQSIFKDGARINNALNASNIPSTETANIERIEVLKGPSALLYGQGQPGGIINYITKRPEFERQSSLELVAGRFDYYRVEGDTAGAIPTRDNTLAYRLVVAYEDSKSFRDEVARQRLLVHPTLAWTPNKRLAITLGYEYIDDDYTQDRGQVLDGNNVDGYFYSGRLNASQFFGIPDWNVNTVAQAKRFYAIADAQLADFWRIEATYANTETDKTNVDSSPFPLTPQGHVVGALGSRVENRVAIGARQTVGGGETSQVTVKNFLEFSDGLGFEHKILASYTLEDFTTVSESFRGDRPIFYNVATGRYFSAFDPAEALNPGFFQATSSVGFALKSRGSRLNQKFEEQGINVLDYITLNERFAVLVGGRHSEFANTLAGFEDDDFSLRGGVVYTPRDKLSFYASYSEGYLPSGGLLDIDDRQIDAETARSYEAGVKLALRDERLLITAALFDVTQQGKPFVVNPFDANGEPTLSANLRFGNIGEIQTEGFELEIAGQITHTWRLQGGYAYIDSTITAGGSSRFGAFFKKGNRIGGIARHNFNVFTFYEWQLAQGELGIGGGVFAIGDVFVSEENRAQYAGWTQVDLASFYKRGHWKVQLNVANLFDADYRQAQFGSSRDAFAAIRVGTSAPRTVIGSIAFEF